MDIAEVPGRVKLKGSWLEIKCWQWARTLTTAGRREWLQWLLVRIVILSHHFVGKTPFSFCFKSASNVDTYDHVAQVKLPVIMLTYVSADEPNEGSQSFDPTWVNEPGMETNEEDEGKEHNEWRIALLIIKTVTLHSVDQKGWIFRM